MDADLQISLISTKIELMTKWLVRLASLCAVVAVSVGLLATAAYADDSLESSHYKFIESTLGGGGLVQSNSANFQSTESVGDAAVGNSSSNNFQVNAGPISPKDPTLSFGINNANPTFGAFSSTATATATSSFSVSDYTSYGYIVQIMGDPPTNGSHAIAAMTTTGSPTPGVNQFGINLVKNADPNDPTNPAKSLGLDPDQGQFGAGQAATNYKTPDQYRYVEGETIAKGPKSGGLTTFTISYIANIGSLMPGGEYSSNESLICIATY
jgi:hypothetical protein